MTRGREVRRYSPWCFFFFSESGGLSSYSKGDSGLESFTRFGLYWGFNGENARAYLTRPFFGGYFDFIYSPFELNFLGFMSRI